MGCIRENTIEFDFSNFKREKPPVSVIHTWLKNDIKIKIEFIEGLQVDNEKSLVYIKYVNKECFEKHGLPLCGEQKFTDNKKKIWHVPVREVSDVTYVRVLNVPMEVEMELIQNVLKDYGEIVSSIYEKWGRGYDLPVKSGVRAFRMVLKKPVPSYLSIPLADMDGSDDDFDFITAQIIYTGQTKTCRICKDDTHFARNCPRKNHARFKANWYWQKGKNANQSNAPPVPPNNEVEFPSLKSPTKPADTMNEQEDESQNIVENTQEVITHTNDSNKEHTLEETQSEELYLEQIRKRMREEEEGSEILIDNEENFVPLSQVVQQVKEAEKNEAKKKKAEASKQNVSVVKLRPRASSLQRLGSSSNTPRSRAASRASSTSSTDGGAEEGKKTGGGM
jgi:hypothetical protein